jgi:flagellar hook assembly protein FlgD
VEQVMWVDDLTIASSRVKTGVDDSRSNSSSSTKLTLYPNYPNPVNPVTTIRYSLIQNGFVEIEILDLLGRKVRTLKMEYTARGQHFVTWDGTDDNGSPVSSGIYIYRLTAGEISATRKLLVLR